MGAAIGPTVAGVMMGWLGASALPLHFALAFDSLAGYALFQSRRGADEIVETAAHFTPVLRTSPAALEMMTPDEHAPSDDAGADIVQPAGPAPATESAIPR
jgi:hypothetical protein